MNLSLELYRIPLFPTFKYLELGDRKAILNITKKFEPYSDFDFGSMWSWDYSESIQISQLFGNLIVKFIDYGSGESFLSFVGGDRVNDTALALLAYSEASGLGAELRLIPKVVADSLEAASFIVEEDADNFDYVYSLKIIADYQGGDFYRHRTSCRTLLRNCPKATVEILNLSEMSMRSALLDLFEEWQEQKAEKSDNDHERIALTRCLEASQVLDLVAVGLFTPDRIIAFSIVGILQDGFCICHFEKAAFRNYPGVYPFLKNRMANILVSRGLKYMNFEQDLGIPGLRENKRSYAPVSMLYKYKVRNR